jgi:hypothetical protein
LTECGAFTKSIYPWTPGSIVQLKDGSLGRLTYEYRGQYKLYLLKRGPRGGYSKKRVDVTNNLDLFEKVVGVYAGGELFNDTEGNS